MLTTSEADTETYFDLFDPEAIYLGTDAEERWTKEEFRAYAEPYFSQGRGWTYRPIERHLFVLGDAGVAWFDERLENDAYGETRGSGVLVRRGPPPAPWRILQYNLSFPVPNELARDLVERIRALGED